MLQFLPDHYRWLAEEIELSNIPKEDLQIDPLEVTDLTKSKEKLFLSQNNKAEYSFLIDISSKMTKEDF